MDELGPVDYLVDFPADKAKPEEIGMSDARTRESSDSASPAAPSDLRNRPAGVVRWAPAGRPLGARSFIPTASKAFSPSPKDESPNFPILSSDPPFPHPELLSPVILTQRARLL